MADIGLVLDRNRLILTTGREFNGYLQLVDPATNLPVNWPAGTLYFEFADGVPTHWNFTITGADANLSVAHTVVDLIKPSTKWQLVFVATGDTSGGVAVGRGITVVQS